MPARATNRPRQRGPIADYSDEGGALEEARRLDLELADKIEREMNPRPASRPKEIWHPEEGECDEPAAGESE